MPRQSAKAAKPVTVYEVRNTVTGALEGRHERRKDADREVARLNKEAQRDGVRHIGVPVSYEVVTESGVIIGGN